MKKLQFYSNIALLTLLVLSYGNAEKLKKNANAGSDVDIDTVGESMIPVFGESSIGTFFPWVCAEVSRLNNDADLCKVAHKKYHASHPAAEQRLLSRRNDALKIKNTFVAKVREMSPILFSTCPAEQHEHLKEMLIHIEKYVHMTSSLQTSKDLTHVNCGEHAKEALFKEMLKAKNNQWPKDRPKVVHEISVSSGSDNHVFIVSGSATLQEVCKTHKASQNLPLSPVVIHNPQVIKDILKKYDGTVIDQWNNPDSGGVVLSAKAARNKFNMYGGLNTKYNELRIVETKVLDVHQKIEEMLIPNEIKLMLHKLAGPNLDDLERELFPSNHPEL